ncbi:hypothetical protein SEPL_209 [Salmonella phage SE_PL]|uniref:hypothetical protein n=1 Tax=Salmonella enterica TaxID=28901 RepID=UPI000FDF66DE|nr:hypothetical protein CPT_Munch_218 [Salmonella phage Munch]ECV9084139.1 hypothetical protein [Salmonella enterica subsp. enterica serovar Infantis]EME3783175.1 hypothetical protein [Salmonella enterica]QCW18905.1 hypothetical protein 7t3_0384 [Salmonella phage 7t3]QIG62822.1 hypothetical protein SEPL_209 [Salmonella phage SE_PL]
MIDNKNIQSVLTHLQNNDLLYNADDWEKTNSLTEVYVNTFAHRITINIHVPDDNTLKGIAFYLFKNKFVYISYYNIDTATLKCEKSRDVSIRSDIETEEEFFQESCISDLNDLEYSNYKLLREIIDMNEDFLWSS